MRNALALISVSALLSACCTNGSFCGGSFASAACDDRVVEGYTRTVIAYGDGMMAVVPVSKIRPNTEWRFYLKPTALGGALPRADASISIDGQHPADPPVASGGNNEWIETDGDYATAERVGKLRYLAQCTPEDLVTGDYHKFEVTIDKIGMLDPRGHVE